jgi:pilus assembly protein CpaB
MNRRTRTLIVMAVALVCAAVASLAVYYAVRQIVQLNERDRPKQVDVAVAARPVSMGICLGEDDVKIVQWPATTKIDGVHPRKEDVLGRGLVASVVENEPLTDRKLAPAKAGCGLPPSIQTGKRAISVKVNEVIGVAGFVVPGAQVDVLVTIRQERQTTSRVVVSNVQVLTAGTSYDQEKAKDGKPVPTTVVTLMVAPSDAERIALAAAEGQILLTLRNPLDKAATETPGVTTPDLIAGPRPASSGGTAPRNAPYSFEKIAKGERSRQVLR